jgi:hypothetical protein
MYYADTWAASLAALSLCGVLLLSLWLLRVRRQFLRGERFWTHRPFRMVRAVALVGMAGTLWWMLASLLRVPAPEPVKIAAPVVVAAMSVTLAAAAILGLAPRRPQR